MDLTVLQLPVDVVKVDEAVFPDRDTRHIVAHLAYYLSLASTWPAITARVTAAGTYVTGGHKYLQVARLLARPVIRAIIEPASEPEALMNLLRLPGVRQLDVKVLQSEGEQIAGRWHVFYFERSISAAERERFDTEVAGFFETLAAKRQRNDQDMPVVEHLQYDAIHHRIAFYALAPYGDESWFGSYLGRMQRFSAECVPIVSYQGRRFPWSTGRASPA